MHEFYFSNIVLCIFSSHTPECIRVPPFENHQSRHCGCSRKAFLKKKKKKSLNRISSGVPFGHSAFPSLAWPLSCCFCRKLREVIMLPNLSSMTQLNYTFLHLCSSLHLIAFMALLLTRITRGRVCHHHVSQCVSTRVCGLEFTRTQSNAIWFQ